MRTGPHRLHYQKLADGHDCLMPGMGAFFGYVLTRRQYTSYWDAIFCGSGEIGLADFRVPTMPLFVIFQEKAYHIRRISFNPEKLGIFLEKPRYLQV